VEQPSQPRRVGGGSAAAVAAGLCAAATASDGAGSIRIPASSCGVPRPAAVGPVRIARSFKAALRPTWVQREVRASLHNVADALRRLGHDVTEPDPSYGRASDAVVARYLNGIAQDATRFAEPERLQRRTRGFIRLATLVPQPLATTTSS
jgi:amidase